MKNAIEMTVATLFCALLTVNVALAGEAGTTMSDCQDWTTEEFWAAASVSDVRRCFDNGPIDPDSRASELYGRTPLHAALGYGATAEVAGALILAGADVNIQDRDGMTLLQIVTNPTVIISARRPEVVEMLIQAGADINVRDYFGETPLHYAAALGNTEIVNMLIQAGADVNAKDNGYGVTPLHIAIRENHAEIVDALTQAGANIATEMLDCQDWEGFAFWVSASVSEVQRCFDHGPNTEGTNNLRPLHYAVEHGTTEIVEALIQAGADVNAVNNNDDTPLFYAASKNRTEIVEALIQAGADVNARTEHGSVILHWVVDIIDTETIAVFIQAGADINAKDDFGGTPLQYAVNSNNTEIVEILIRAGANTDTESSSGQTPLHDAASRNDTELVEILIQAGADVNARNDIGQIPLHYAVAHHNAEVVEALARAGSQIDIIYDGDALVGDHTLLDLARISNRQMAAILTRLNPLHLSVLPTSRSVLTGQQAGVFATAINGGNAIRIDCGIHLNNAPSGLEFRYFLTDEQNRIIGEPNSMVTLDPGAEQSYLIEFTSQTALDSIELFPTFACSEQTPSNPVSLLNSVTLSVGATPALDIIAMASTASNDGVLRGIPGEPLAFGVASSNLGAAGQVSVQARAIGAGASAADMLICQTDPTTGNCLAGAPEERAIANLAANEVSTWTVLLVDSGQVPFNPAENRIMVEFFDDDGVRRGGTSVALSLMEN